MPPIDTLTEKEFFGVFDRVSDYVDLKGAFTPEAIMERVKASKAYRTPVKKYSTRKRKWVREKGGLGRLLDARFHHRAAEEFAKFKPDSMITLTILWGKEKAERIKKLMARKRYPRVRVRERMRPGITREREIAERGERALSLRERVFGPRREKRWRS